MAGYITVATEITAFYLGTCAACVRPIRVRDEAATDRTVEIACPECAGRVRAVRLVAETAEYRCDGSCECATGPNCVCSCGGINHGRAWGGRFERETVLVQEADPVALERHRAAQARKAHREAVKARQAAEERAALKRGEFEAWAADERVSAALAALAETPAAAVGFLDKMRAQVARLDTLTPGQLAAVERICVEQRARREREALRRDVPAPLGSAVEVTGVVASTRIDDNPFNPRGGAVCKARVIAEQGYTVWMTVPRAVLTSMGDGPLSDLEGRRLRFVADLVAPKNGDDPTFCLAKRPRKAELL